MNTKLYIGNLSFKATEEELNSLFSAHGIVTDTFIIKDKYSGRSKGFAFVTMDTKEAAESAIEQLNEFEFLGRNIVVNEARPKEERPSRNQRGFTHDR